MIVAEHALVCVYFAPDAMVERVQPNFVRVTFFDSRVEIGEAKDPLEAAPEEGEATLGIVIIIF